MSSHIIFARLSWFLLIYLLLLRPLFDITRWKLLGFLMRYRKQAGIVCGVSAFLHAGLFLADSGIGLPYFGNARYWDFSSLWGWGNLALIAMAFPLITSNRYSQRLLKRRWKPAQQLAYPALLFTAAHVVYAKGETAAGLVPVVIWLALWTWAWVKKKRTSYRRRVFAK